MNIGDKVRIRTGKRGNPPHGEVVAVYPINAMVKRRTTAGAITESYPLDALTVIPDGK